MSEKITCVYVVALLVLSCCGSVVFAACPVTVVPASVTLTDSEVQGASGRARIQMLNLLVDVRPINGSTTVDTSAGLVAAPRTTGYEASGLAGGESPQGFFLRYLPRLNGMIRYASVIQMTASSSSSYNFSIAWTLDVIADYSVARDEYIDVSFAKGFFGPSSSTGCNDVVYAGTVQIVSTSNEDGMKAFTLATSFVCMILTAIGWRHPGKAIDAQTMVAMSFTSCAEPHSRAFTGVERILAPFALSLDLGGMLAGNAIAIAAVWIVGFALMMIVGKSRSAKSMEEAGSSVFFPRVPFLFMMALYQGTTFCAVRLIAHGSAASNSGQLVGGIIASIVLIVVIPVLTYLYCIRGVLGEFHAYNTENVNFVWKVFAPKGQWLPKSVRQAAGGVVGFMCREERIFGVFIFVSPITSAVILAVQPSDAAGCMVQYTVFLAMQIVMVMLNTWFSPWRTTTDNILSVLSHIALSCAGAMYGSSLDQQVDIYGLIVPLCFLLVICWLRVASDILSTLMDHSGLDLAGRLFFWHDGTRGDLDNVYEVKVDPRNDFPDPLLPEDDEPESMLSPLSSYATMTTPPLKRDETLHTLLKSPMHAPKSPSPARPLDDDPFADESDDPLRSLDAKKSSMRIEPSIATTVSVSHVFDDDPFADNTPVAKPVTPSIAPPDAAPKPKSKFAGIAKKLLLAAKFKSSVDEKVEQRAQKEMFGDVDDDDMLRGKSLDKQKTMGDVNDLLEQMGDDDNASRANPMSAIGAASAFSDNQAAKNKAGKVIGGGDLAANFKTNKAVEEKVDDDNIAVYRVEFSVTKKKMTLVEQDEKEFGSFFDGDSYVVVSTRVPKPKGPSKVTRDIFVWIGQVSTPDEIRAAVTEAVGLDCSYSSDFHKDVTKGGHKITRIIQNAETTSFTSLFPEQTIKIIEGGVDEEGGTQARLYHVHGEGARKMNLTLVPPTVDSLDDGDVFVFDCGIDVYIFQGSECSPFEREHGRQYGEKLRASRAQCTVQVVTQENAPDRFWKTLGTTRKIGQSMTLKRLDNFLHSNINRLWVVKGAKDFKLEASGDDVTVSALNSHSVMIVDLCSVIYVWIGAKVSPYKEQRDAALQRGVEYLEKHSDKKTPLIRVLEGNEGETFKDMMPGADDVDL
jgi:gelsolin